MEPPKMNENVRHSKAVLYKATIVEIKVSPPSCSTGICHSIVVSLSDESSRELLATSHRSRPEKRLQKDEITVTNDTREAVDMKTVADDMMTHCIKGVRFNRQKNRLFQVGDIIEVIVRELNPLKLAVEKKYIKPLLVFDIHGVLGARQPFQRKNVDRKFMLRPHCREFLQSCYDNFEIAVWSSALKKNLSLSMFNNENDVGNVTPLFVWSQRDITNMYPIMSFRKSEKPLHLKCISKIWDAYPCYDSTNSLLLDDDLEKCATNPYGTLMLIPTFNYDDSNDVVFSLTSPLILHLRAIADESENSSLENLNDCVASRGGSEIYFPALSVVENLRQGIEVQKQSMTHHKNCKKIYFDAAPASSYNGSASRSECFREKHKKRRHSDSHQYHHFSTYCPTDGGSHHGRSQDRFASSRGQDKGTECRKNYNSYTRNNSQCYKNTWSYPAHDRYDGFAGYGNKVWTSRGNETVGGGLGRKSHESWNSGFRHGDKRVRSHDWEWKHCRFSEVKHVTTYSNNRYEGYERYDKISSIHDTDEVNRNLTWRGEAGRQSNIRNRNRSRSRSRDRKSRL